VVIPDLLGGRVEEQRVDGEIAARRVLLLGAEHVVAQNPSVLVRDALPLFLHRVRAAERGDFHHLRPAHHVHQAEAPPDHPRAPEQPAHFLGRGVGRDVEILGPAAEQQIAHRAADDEGCEAMALQRLRRAQRARADRIAADAMRAVRDDLRLRRPEQLTGEDLAQETPDHGILTRA
jgi:hypothetical protein